MLILQCSDLNHNQLFARGSSFWQDGLSLLSWHLVETRMGSPQWPHIPQAHTPRVFPSLIVSGFLHGGCIPKGESRKCKDS